MPILYKKRFFSRIDTLILPLLLHRALKMSQSQCCTVLIGFPPSNKFPMSVNITKSLSRLSYGVKVVYRRAKLYINGF